jgi:hypothetical protein
VRGGGKGGRFVGLTTLPPSCADCLEIQGASDPWTVSGDRLDESQQGQESVFFAPESRLMLGAHQTYHGLSPVLRMPKRAADDTSVQSQA